MPRTRGLFDAWSRFYDVPLLQALTYGRVHAAVVAALRGGTPPRRVLDVGCGTGLLGRRLARELAPDRVVGCDVSLGMLRRASGAPIDRVQGDALRLPFRAGSFDAVVCTAAFHWFADQGVALREARRVLVAGGRLLIAGVSPSRPSIGNAARRLSRAAGAPLSWPTAAGLHAEVVAAGLRVESQRRIRGLPLAWLLPPILTIAVRPGDAAVREETRCPS